MRITVWWEFAAYDYRVMRAYVYNRSFTSLCGSDFKLVKERYFV